MYFTYASRAVWAARDITVFFFEIASAHARNTHADRSHVWHMKVLHYTVFKDRRMTLLERPDRDCTESVPKDVAEHESSLEVVPSKLSSTADSSSR